MRAQIYVSQLDVAIRGDSNDPRDGKAPTTEGYLSLKVWLFVPPGSKTKSLDKKEAVVYTHKLTSPS